MRSRPVAASANSSASAELSRPGQQHTAVLTAGEIGTRADLTRGYYWDHHHVT